MSDAQSGMADQESYLLHVCGIKNDTPTKGEGSLKMRIGCQQLPKMVSPKSQKISAFRPNPSQGPRAKDGSYVCKELQKTASPITTSIKEDVTETLCLQECHAVYRKSAQSSLDMQAPGVSGLTERPCPQ